MLHNLTFQKENCFNIKKILIGSGYLFTQSIQLLYKYVRANVLQLRMYIE